MWTLEQVRAEYHRLDRLLGIDTSGIPVRFSKRMTRQYGVCTFLKNRPQEIRLADFLRRNKHRSLSLWLKWILYIYEGAEHKHEAQSPKAIDINLLK